MSTTSDNVARLRVPAAKHDYDLVPAGVYEAVYATDYTGHYFRNAPKLVVLWRLADADHLGAIIPAYYAVPAVIGKPRRHGRYAAVGRGSKLARDIAALLGRRPHRLDGPFPADDVRGRLYRVEVVTVDRDFRQRPLPKGACYSRIERVLERGE